MFLYMGELTVHTGIGRDLFECLNRWIGRVPGGLAVASIGGCAGFGAVCGDSMATTVTMSSVALPHMRAKKYDHALATGALAAGGSLGSLIPPSICFVIYSIMTEESVGRLFIAGIFPGLLLACIFIGIIIFRVKRNPALAPASDIYTLHEKIISLVYLLPVAGLFILVIGGIMGGFFTPGEGGAVGAAGVVLYGIVQRRLSWDGFKRATLSTTLICGKILFLIASVGVIKVFLTSTRLPIELANSIVTMDVNRFIVLAMIILLYVFLGSVANIIPMMMITLPSIFPTVQALGFDGIWFGVLIVIVMEMGVITPPIGINVFALSAAVPDIEMITIFKGVWPFFLGMVLCVIIVASFPQIALFLPNLLF
jgi:tripartite ATP-independent transporter DctM subunit